MYTITLYLLALLFSFFLSAGVAIYVWRRRGAPGALAYCLISANQALWTLFFIFEQVSPTLHAKIFWDNLQWIASALVPLFFLGFVSQFSGVRWKRPCLSWLLLCAPMFFFLVLVFTDPWHRLVAINHHLVAGFPFPQLEYVYGISIYLFALYSYVLILVAVVQLVNFYLRSPRAYRRQASMVVVGIIIPLLGSLSSVLGFHLFGLRDLSPFTFAIGNVFVAIGLSRFHLFDLVPTARDQVVEKLADGVWVLDVQQRVVYLNPSAACYAAIAAESAIGRTVGEVCPAWNEVIKRLGDPDTNWLVYQAVSQPDSQQVQHLQFQVTPLVDRQGRLVGRLLLVHDITELKEVEAELRRHQQQLETLVKQRTAELQDALQAVQRSADILEQSVAERTAALEAKNRELETFAYSVSHDLKAPLRHVDGYGRLLLEDYGSRLEDEGRLYLANILRAASQMNRLIDDLLTYSREQRRPLTTTTVGLAEVVGAALAERQSEIQALGVQVSVNLACANVQAEAAGLLQALRNLVDNALKFSRDASPPRLEIGSRQEGERCILWVKDNGIGFDMRYSERVFEIFQRLNLAEDYPGTGVGLALVSTVMQRIGGHAWAESAPGQGATFFLEMAAL